MNRIKSVREPLRLEGKGGSINSLVQLEKYRVDRKEHVVAKKDAYTVRLFFPFSVDGQSEKPKLDRLKGSKRIGSDEMDVGQGGMG